MEQKPQPHSGQTVDDYLVNYYLPWLERKVMDRVEELVEQRLNPA